MRSQKALLRFYSNREEHEGLEAVNTKKFFLHGLHALLGQNWAFYEFITP
jgi:hypothetical protein